MRHRNEPRPIIGYRIKLRLEATGVERQVGMFMTRHEAKTWLREMGYRAGDGVHDRIAIEAVRVERQQRAG